MDALENAQTRMKSGKYLTNGLFLFLGKRLLDSPRGVVCYTIVNRAAVIEQLKQTWETPTSCSSCLNQARATNSCSSLPVAKGQSANGLENQASKLNVRHLNLSGYRKPGLQGRVSPMGALAADRKLSCGFSLASFDP